MPIDGAYDRLSVQGCRQKPGVYLGVAGSRQAIGAGLVFHGANVMVARRGLIAVHCASRPRQTVSLRLPLLSKSILKF